MVRTVKGKLQDNLQQMGTTNWPALLLLTQKQINNSPSTALGGRFTPHQVMHGQRSHFSASARPSVADYKLELLDMGDVEDRCGNGGCMSAGVSGAWMKMLGCAGLGVGWAGRLAGWLLTWPGSTIPDLLLQRL